MTPNIQSCVKYCEEIRGTPLILMIPENEHALDLDNLLAEPGIAGVVISDRSESIENERVGRLADAGYSWQLPDVPARTIAVLGPRTLLSFRMAVTALRNRITTFVYRSKGHWTKESTAAFILRRLVERGYYELSRNRVFEILLLQYHRKNLEKAVNQPALLSRKQFSEKKILLFNNSLAWGGAERQLVNTINGLTSQSNLNVTLICDDLNAHREHNFFRDHIPKEATVTLLEGATQQALTNLDEDFLERLRTRLKLLPIHLAEQVFDVAVVLADQKPAVVHAWQDSTNIKVGLAAAFLGVPKIILSMRNMAAIHFAYYTPYMSFGYRSLSKLKHVTFLNNSNPGAQDYTHWLGLEENRIKVIHNGLDPVRLDSIDDPSRIAYRKSLGIPLGKTVIGSIFRFYEEKDPLLWVNTAAVISKKKSDVAFVIFGTGPMRKQIGDRAEELGIRNSLFLPGTEGDTAMALSAIDVFLLTSKFEGTPNVLIEAQWAGIPVVSTDAGGSRDTFADGETGWLSTTRKPSALADYVTRCIDDEDWRSNAIIKSRDFVSERFGLDRMVKETLAVYEE